MDLKKEALEFYFIVNESDCYEEIYAALWEVWQGIKDKLTKIETDDDLMELDRALKVLIRALPNAEAKTPFEPKPPYRELVKLLKKLREWTVNRLWSLGE